MPAYALVRSRKRRTLCLQINPAGQLRLLVPTTTSQGDIDAFLDAKSQWIHRTLARLEKISKAPPFATGMALRYLDETLRLQLNDGPDQAGVRRYGETLAVTASNPTQARAKLELWYRNEARHHSVARIIHFAPLVGHAPKRIRIAGQKTRWGSCSTRATISLNWRLMLVPERLFDYVVAHELCHLIAPHHGPQFWRELGRVMPDYEDRRAQLRDIGSQLTF
ncbi:MAG TPA: SprT family zinc-dependent metalloprotease [Acidiferrobacter sp.]|nr:SprT family zinc-dependent metalloprotease [Acidiferrobacter sp.]